MPDFHYEGPFHNSIALETKIVIFRTSGQTQRGRGKNFQWPNINSSLAKMDCGCVQSFKISNRMPNFRSRLPINQ